jgi:predicted nucleotidyltransferase
MAANEKILNEIKKAVHEITPDAKVILFGSRVTGNIHEESDWDILVLTKEKKEKKIKWEIHKKLYPIALSNDTFIHLTFTNEDEWENGSRYYSLKLGITNQMIAL